MEEQKLQRNLTVFFEKNGFLVVKLIKTTCNGIPDLMILKDGRVFFIEVKKDVKTKARPLQLYRIEQLKRLGFEAYVIGDFDVEFLNKISLKNT